MIELLFGAILFMLPVLGYAAEEVIRFTVYKKLCKGKKSFREFIN